MFLEAGNELDVHAARACLAAVLDTDAELVAGRWEVARGQQDPAVLEMFRHTTHVASIAGPAVNALCDYLTLRARVLELEAERDVRRMTGTPHHPEEGTP